MSQNATNGTVDPCAYNAPVEYEQWLNITAVFVILVASLLGTSMPLLAKRFPKYMPGPFLFVMGKHIGTGVLLALGLIHLLAPAFEELGNPCLPAPWLAYQYAPLFALIATLAMHFLEMLAMLCTRPAHSHPHEEHKTGDPESGNESPDEHGHEGHSHSVLLGSSVERTVSAYVLEFGLTSHSIIIGIAVGVAGFSELQTLLPALTFHQFFEGFALGARLAEVGFSGLNEVILTSIFAASCPIGIAIGIGIYSTYNTNGVTANLVQGTFDAVAAGIIIYVAYVQMLAFEFLKDIKLARGFWRKSALFICMWTGAAVMAFIGKYL